MRLRLGACNRYLPRLLTVMVFGTVAGSLVLANLSDEMSRRAKTPAALLDVPSFDLAEPDPADVGMGIYQSWSLSYGWPLLWNQYVCAFTGGPSGITGWCYSPTRLAIDMAAWFVMLAAPTAACECILRRYQPRLRWSLRAMLAAVGLFGVICAWFDMARKRAELQEPIIASGATVWVERWGPRWLEVAGVDPFCRRIVGVYLPDYLWEETPQTEGILRQLEGLRDLQFLSLEASELTPSMAAVLGEMRQLRSLSISVDELRPDMGDSLAVALDGMQQLCELSITDTSSSNDQGAKRVWHECLDAIGNSPQLKSLWLDGGAIDSKSLGCLAGLTNLEMLSVDIDISLDQPAEPGADQSPLEHLPPLPQLSTLDLASFDVDDDDLNRLAILPSLKSLSLRSTRTTCAGLAKLAAVQSLEELVIDNDAACAAAFDALHAVKGLKTLRFRPAPFTERHLTGNIALDDGGKLHVPEEEISATVTALDALRTFNPGIAIDIGEIALNPLDALTKSRTFEIIPDNPRDWGHRFLRAWKEGKGELQPFLKGVR